MAIDFTTATAIEIKAEYDRLIADSLAVARRDDWSAYASRKAKASRFASAARSALCRKIHGAWHDSSDGIGFEMIEPGTLEEFVCGYSLRRAVERRDLRAAAGLR